MENAHVPLLITTWRPILLCGLLLASKVWQDIGYVYLTIYCSCSYIIMIWDAYACDYLGLGILILRQYFLSIRYKISINESVHSAVR
jgi:hypothetical protein